MTSVDPILVRIPTNPDYRAAEEMPRGAERKQAAFAAASNAAVDAQAPAVAVVERLKNEGAVAGYEALISPSLLVITPASDADRAKVLDAFKAVEGVTGIWDCSAKLVRNGGAGGGSGSAPAPAPAAPAPTPSGHPAPPAPAGAPGSDTPYGLDMVGAPEAWARGADGRGLVYGSIDSGVDVDHPALRDKFRGHVEGTNDYAFYDPMGRSDAPQDFEGHGTGTTGVVVGDGVGVAPGATFIAAAGREPGPGGLRADAFAKSLDWMFAPRKQDGTAPDPTKAPDVVGMSMTMAHGSDDLFGDAFRDMRAAGIVPVKSAGNLGPGPGTIGAPGGNEDVIAVGALDSSGRVTDFSSRGPVESGVLKPDFAAPGARVRTTQKGGSYGDWDGTSLAQPHVSGAVLDLLSAHPGLTPEQIYDALRTSARDAGLPGPDSDYGHGVVDIPHALDALEARAPG